MLSLFSSSILGKIFEIQFLKTLIFKKKSDVSYLCRPIANLFLQIE